MRKELRDQLRKDYGLTADPYKILKVDRRASHNDIKKAYEAKALLSHDPNSEQFKQLTLAYEVLSKHRKAVDAVLVEHVEESQDNSNKNNSQALAAQQAEIDLENSQQQELEESSQDQILKKECPNYKLEKVNLPRPDWAMPIPTLKFDMAAKKLPKNSLEFWRDKSNPHEGKALFSTVLGVPGIFANPANNKNAIAAVLLAKSMNVTALTVSANLPKEFREAVEKSCAQYGITFKLENAPTPIPAPTKKKEKEEENPYKTPIPRATPFKS